MAFIGLWLCFPGSASVATPQGPKAMKDLGIGDTVRVVTPEGRAEWSQACGWLHRAPTQAAEYVCLTTSRRKLVVSDAHLVGVVRAGVVEFVPAGEVTVGSALLECDVVTATGNANANPNSPNPNAASSPSVWGNAVTQVGRVRAMGVYAPLTVAGTIVVDGVAASCYAATRSHKAAHAAMKPMRSMWKHDPERMKAQQTGGGSAAKHIEGAHRYVDVLARVQMARHRGH